MTEEVQGDRSRANYQIRSDLNVEFGDMNLWDDRRIIEAAAENAIELCGAASWSKKTGDEIINLARPICTVLAWCMTHADEIKFPRKAVK